MILTDPAVLREVSQPATSEEAPGLILRLIAELEASGEAGRPGIGLSAPQIGVKKRVAIIRVPIARNKILSVNLVNPKITHSYQVELFDGEGCLSFPGVSEKTYRFQEIVVENDIEPKRFIATGLFAICIQHEIDHLDGKILPDFSIKKLTDKQKPAATMNLKPVAQIKFDNLADLILNKK